MLRRMFIFISIILILLVSTSCGKNGTPTEPSNTATPAPVVHTLGISPDVFLDRWNNMVTQAETSNLSLKEAPGAGGTDKTTYNLMKDITMTVNVLQDQKKVRDLTIKTNMFKLDEGEQETLGEITFLVIQAVEPELTEEEFNNLLDELSKDVSAGHDQTVVKGNTSFRLKISTIGNMQLIVKNKNA